VLEETKLRLTQPSFVELGLGLSLAIVNKLKPINDIKAISLEKQFELEKWHKQLKPSSIVLVFFEFRLNIFTVKTSMTMANKNKTKNKTINGLFIRR
jgi:hypothetical protein